MTQSNDLSQRVDRTEGQIVDLQMTANLILQAIDKNSQDIAVLIEVSRRNSDGIAALQLSQLRTEAVLQVFQQHTDAAIERQDAAIERHDATIERLDATIEQLRASNERTEQLLEYVIRRDRGQLE
jgi:hypothetical protein